MEPALHYQQPARFIPDLTSSKTDLGMMPAEALTDAAVAGRNLD